MSKVAVMTDTTVQMTQDAAKKHGIRLVPLYVIIDGKAFPEHEMDLDWFYGQLPKWKEESSLPTTSSPSSGDFLAAYHELRHGSDAVVHISISSRFGAAFSSATQASKMAEREAPKVPFEVVDSLGTCVGQMFVALAAAEAAAGGKTLTEVIQAANRAVEMVNYLILSDDLSYLAHGGRTHQAGRWVGSRISNAVIMEVDAATGGEHKPVSRHRTRNQALKRLVEIVEERSGRHTLHIAIVHANAPDEADKLRHLLTSRFRCAECSVSRALPIVALHGGLGSLKLGWWYEEY